MSQLRVNKKPREIVMHIHNPTNVNHFNMVYKHECIPNYENTQ
jgi:hypothetical protein